MRDLLWNTPEKLEKLLTVLVGWDSRTFTRGEENFPDKLKKELKKLTYFRENPENLYLYPADRNRSTLIALYKTDSTNETVVLMSHFDTVHTDDYGHLEPLALDPARLESALLRRKGELPEEVQCDLDSGDYLFGRGTMDMKAGIALHLSVLEQAVSEGWPINIVMVSVPDEEANSAGMRSAVKELASIQTKQKLRYRLFLNSEPSFTEDPSDTHQYIYSGSIGKVMPAALFYGKETHAGQPLKGLNANYMASFLTQKMEWNPHFSEIDGKENTPLPVCLEQKDLKSVYSTKTPHSAIALYNVFIFRHTAADIMALFEKTAQEAAEKCNESYSVMCSREGIMPEGKIRVIRYHDLYNYAEKKLGKEHILQLKQETIRDKAKDEREKAFEIAERLMEACPELTPATVLLLAPSYYPAVNSSDDPLVRDSVKLVKEVAASFGVSMKEIRYFNGICDLSYINYTGCRNECHTMEADSPGWGELYEVPFEYMRKLKAPVLNIGPAGKDAHQRTERLLKRSAFVHLPAIYEKLILTLCQKQ